MIEFQRPLARELPRRAKDLSQRALLLPGNVRCQRLASRYRIANDDRRVYFHHIRKTAGTSLCWAMLSITGRNGAQIYDRLARSFLPRLVLDDKIFVGWQWRLIQQGHYYFAFSHTPAHALSLPPATYTITCLRDPVKRVISHYRMLREFQATEPTRPVLLREGHWLGNSFADFIDRLPREHLLRQVYMFSPRFDPAEAADAVADCSCVLTTEAFDAGLARLSQTLGHTLTHHRAKGSGFTVEVDDHDVERLRDRLEPEYRMYDQLGPVLDAVR
ncbi:hypothetical protein ACERK3_15365 [Phycisphaerales bacterium AB-hyl4]|uniref:Sulfotransferase family protein n=1 Tax=Natronomicrosphaera hydrolytica TaxID=3242702 RepID=A0ABV4UAA0_9BACT